MLLLMKCSLKVSKMMKMNGLKSKSLALVMTMLWSLTLSTFSNVAVAQTSKPNANDRATATPIEVPTAVYLCDDAAKKSCHYYETTVSIPMKEQYAKRNIMQDLVRHHVSDAVKKVDSKSNKDLSLIEMDMKGHLYRAIDYISRTMNDKILEKYLIEVNIKPR